MIGRADDRRTTGWRAIDPWGPVIAAAGLVVFVVQGFDGILTRDLALYGYGAQQVVEGVPPYESVLNRAGPLAHLVPAIGVAAARVLGVDDLLGMRVLMLVLSVVICWVLYLVGRDVFRSRLAGLATVSALLTFEGFVTYATGGPREKTTMALLVILTFWMLAKRRWFASGVLVALATLTWQPVFLTASAAVLVAITALRWREIPRAVGAFGLGGLLTTGLFVLGFWLAGALEEFLEAFLFINAEYTDQQGLLSYFDQALDFTIDGFGASLVVIVTGLAGMILVGAARAPSAYRSRDATEVAVVALGASCVAGLLWSLRAYNGWADIVVLLPGAALGIGALARELHQRLPARAGTIAVAGFSATCLVVGLISSIANYEDVLKHQRAEVEAMLAIAPDDASMLSVGAPQPLMLTQRRNPIRHQMFLTGLNQYVDDTYPGGLAGLVEVIEGFEPTFVMIDHPTWYNWLGPTLESEYVAVATTVGNWTWYVHKSVGPDVIAELKAADTSP